MPDPERTDTEGGTLLDWMRSTAWVALRVTLSSFAVTAVVAALLVVIHQELAGEGASSLRVLGYGIDLTSVTGGQQSLVLLVAALAGWAVLSSLSALMVAVQVRSYLHQLSPAAEPTGPDGATAYTHTTAATDADADDDGGPGGTLIAERLLLQTYLGLLSNGARATALTVALLVSLPLAAAPGVLLTCLMTAMVGRHRYRIGASHQSRLGPVAKRWRSAGDSESHRAMVEALYERESFQRRLTVPQVVVLVGVALVGVIVPAWIVGGDSGGLALALTLIWLQGLMLVATELAPFGWRWAGRMARPSARDNQSRPRVQQADWPLVVTWEAPPSWPSDCAVWAPQSAGARTVVLAPGGPRLAGADVPSVLAALRSAGVSVLALPRPEAEGYPTLGSDLSTVRGRLAGLLDPSTTLVVASGSARAFAQDLWDGIAAHVVLAGGHPSDGRRWLESGSILADADHASALLDGWFASQVTDPAPTTGAAASPPGLPVHGSDAAER